MFLNYIIAKMNRQITFLLSVLTLKTLLCFKNICLSENPPLITSLLKKRSSQLIGLYIIYYPSTI